MLLSYSRSILPPRAEIVPALKQPLRIAYDNTAPGQSNTAAADPDFFLLQAASDRCSDYGPGRRHLFFYG